MSREIKNRIKISRGSPEWREAICDANRLSPCSQFYFYNDKIFEVCSYYNYMGTEVNDIREANLRKKFEKKFKKQREEYYGIVERMKDGIILNTFNLIKNKQYKFKVNELCKLEDVKVIDCSSVEKLIEYYKRCENWISYNSSLLMVVDYNFNKIGFYADGAKNTLELGYAKLYFVSFDMYREYMGDSNLFSTEESEKVTRFEIMDFEEE
jgi:hypothetical protein